MSERDPKTFLVLLVGTGALCVGCLGLLSVGTGAALLTFVGSAWAVGFNLWLSMAAATLLVLLAIAVWAAIKVGKSHD